MNSPSDDQATAEPSSAVTLRPASVADQPTITRLILRNGLNIWGTNWDGFTVAVDDNDRCVGCGQIKRHGDVRELASLVVADAWQGRGVAGRLMDTLMVQGGRPLWLMCESPLVDYYRKYGFEEVQDPSQLPAYFQGIYWAARLPFAIVFLSRGTYLAFMVLQD